MSQGILVTGGAGFIGSHLVDTLLARGESVVVLDQFNDYYSPAWKRRNLSSAVTSNRFHLVEGDIRDRAAVAAALARIPIDRVVHLAARAGVQPSLRDPVLYADVNVTGTAVVLEAAARAGITQVVVASSSSVYGVNAKIPFAESDPVEHPVSPYAASKRATELQCATFHHLTGIPVTCLRFFTAFGPRNRPDMAVYKFAKSILAGQEIALFGVGVKRDFTYVGDVADGVIAALDRPDGFLICNLGRGEPVSVDELVAGLERTLGREALVTRCPLPAGDVPITWASGEVAEAALGWRPKVSLQDGLDRFADWFGSRAPEEMV